MRHREHIIAENESLMDVAAMYDMPLAWILAANEKRATALGNAGESFAAPLPPGEHIKVPDPLAAAELDLAYRNIFMPLTTKENNFVREAAIGDVPELPLGSMWLGPSQPGVRGPVYPAVALQWWNEDARGVRGGVLGDLPPVDNLPEGAYCEEGEYSDGTCVTVDPHDPNVIIRDNPKCKNGTWDMATRACVPAGKEEESFIERNAAYLAAGAVGLSVVGAILFFGRRKP